MKKIIFIFSLFLFSNISSVQAQLQPGECGIRFSYDATGSLTERVFICNNTSAVMNRQARDSTNKKNSVSLGNSNKSDIATEEIVKVNAIMPNPTSGKFSVRLGEPLNNEKILILDVNGKVIQNSKRSGSELIFDLSNFSSGVYFVKIVSNSKVISFKVVKQ